jgi:hypothetical protein
MKTKFDMYAELNESKTKVRVAIRMLKGMLSWSDRIGSDEICEINEIIKTLNNKDEIQ